MSGWSSFGARFTRPSGALELMSDLGEALAAPGPISMLGGGNPARIDVVEAVFRRRLAEIAASGEEFGRFAASYAGPEGELRFRATVAAALARRYGWPVDERNVVLTSGSQTAFFMLFNLLAGPRADGSRARIVLPLSPEYIGYAGHGVTGDLLLARRAAIEELPDRQFKYRVDFAHLDIPDDAAALCVSRPTNPTGNVITAAELARLDAIARDHGIPLILDAAYGEPFPGIQFAGEHAPPPWNQNLILCLSLSKIGLPGLRTGIVVASEPVARALTAINASTALAPGSAGAVLAGPLIESGELERLCADAIRPHYRAALQAALGWLFDAGSDLPMRVHRPEGAFFLWLWFPQLPIGSSELYRRLKARGVVVVPGAHFFPGLEEPWPHAEECIRVSYAQPPDAVRRGLQIIAEEVRRAHD
jgi:valine--pyruvate aminotransferase